MKKILLISSLYYPHVGGVETMIREMSRYYKARGIEVVVLTKKWPIHLESCARYEDVDIYRVVSARTSEEFNEVISWIKINEQKIKADIIHVIGVRRPLPLIALLLSKYWEVPLICTIAGGEIPDSKDPYPGTIWEEGRMIVSTPLLKCDMLTCVSSALTSSFRNLFPEIPIEKIHTIYAGIDTAFIESAPKESLFDQYILSLRRLDPTKGIDLLIQSFSRIEKEYPQLQLVIAGDGPEKEKLEKLTGELRLSKRIHFIGTIDLLRGMSLLKGALLTVVPSLSEAGGLINVEAQAAGCPVVASNVGGIPEYLIDGESGLLFKSGDVADLTTKIKSILDNPDLARSLMKGGFVHAKKFDWERLVPQYLSLYEQVIRNYSSGSFLKKLAGDDFSSSLWKKLIS